MQELTMARAVKQQTHHGTTPSRACQVQKSVLLAFPLMTTAVVAECIPDALSLPIMHWSSAYLYALVGLGYKPV